MEARLVARGYQLLGAYAARTGIPVERTGALLVAWTDEELATLPKLKAKAEANGYDACRLVDASQVYDRVPDLGPGALGGLTVPGESITCTWTTNLALATDAVRRGADLRRGCRVVGVDRLDGHTVLRTTTGEITARWVVNAAGLGADDLDRAFGHDRFTVTPRRGELFVFDKLARARCPASSCRCRAHAARASWSAPRSMATSCSGLRRRTSPTARRPAPPKQGFAFLLDKGRRLMPTLLDEEVTAAYAGLRAAIDGDDYLIDLDVDGATCWSAASGRPG